VVRYIKSGSKVELRRRAICLPLPPVIVSPIQSRNREFLKSCPEPVRGEERGMDIIRKLTLQSLLVLVGRYQPDFMMFADLQDPIPAYTRF
jgi:hypothetical protein